MEQLKSNGSRLGSLAFSCFAGSIILDGMISLIIAPPGLSVDTVVVFIIVCSVWSLWAIFVAIRMLSGRGRINGILLISIFGFWLMFGITIAAALVPLKTYNAPTIIWVLHGLILTTYIASLISLFKQNHQSPDMAKAQKEKT